MMVGHNNTPINNSTHASAQDNSHNTSVSPPSVLPSFTNSSGSGGINCGNGVGYSGGYCLTASSVAAATLVGSPYTSDSCSYGPIYSNYNTNNYSGAGIGVIKSRGSTPYTRLSSTYGSTATGGLELEGGGGMYGGANTGGADQQQQLYRTPNHAFQEYSPR